MIANISPDNEQRLRDEAAKLGISAETLLVRYLEEYLDELDRRQDLGATAIERPAPPVETDGRGQRKVG